MKKLSFLMLALVLSCQALISTGCGGYWAQSGEQQPGQACCGKDDIQWSRISVTIVKQPQGGTNINQLTCTFKVAYTWEDQKYWDGSKYNYPKGYYPSEGPFPITLFTYWWNGQDRYNEEKTQFTYEKNGGIYTMTLTPKQAGYYFDKTFEASFGWSDKDGNHNPSSQKAVCAVK
jgi:hypothetical protein